MYSMTTASFTGEVNKAENVAAHAVVNAALVAQGKTFLPVPRMQPPARWWG